VVREQLAVDHALQASRQPRPNTLDCIHRIDCPQ
jgi:hypothetical protein